ncbi:MAG: hypothetical protein ABIH52_04355 [Candidatus Aenigmatarchaeota archaeon]
MECPKCGGGSYLAEEELVQVLEGADPVKILIKSIFQCRACSDRFSRLFYDLLESRKRPDMPHMPYQNYSQYPQTQYQQPQTEDVSEEEAAESLKFF